MSEPAYQRLYDQERGIARTIPPLGADDLPDLLQRSAAGMRAAATLRETAPDVVDAWACVLDQMADDMLLLLGLEESYRGQVRALDRGDHALHYTLQGLHETLKEARMAVYRLAYQAHRITRQTQTLNTTEVHHEPRRIQ
jgi:hypothetical protein